MSGDTAFWIISIHAPARGATGASSSRCSRINYFNPRSREGSDIICEIINVLIQYFNPRSREGSDPFARQLSEELRYFNPRSREGSDVSLPINVTLFIYFNPRSREGSDVITAKRLIRSFAISIHAPARGATDSLPPSSPSSFISIHAPARGATGRR